MHPTDPYSPEDLSYRAPGDRDSTIVIALMDRCEIAEYGESDSDIEDLLHNWGNMDLEKDAWLALDPQGVLVGYGSVMSWGKSLRYEFFAAPEWQTPALGAALIARCERRGAEIAAQRTEIELLTAKDYIAQVNDRDRETLIQAGFSFVKYHYQMRARLTEPQSEPAWPTGIQVRNVIPGEDDRQVHALVETAFERPGRHPSTFESWREGMFRADLFDPALWHLALEGGEIVGVSLGFAYPGEGWVRQLAVHPRWQKKGLGSALLRQSFHTFQQRGYDRVGLGVDATNTNAFEFYLRLGMQPFRQYEEYEKAITG